MTIVQRQLASKPEIKQLIEIYAQAVMNCHGIDIYSGPPMKNVFYSSINRFINVYGLENAIGIIKTAYSGKYQGRYRGKIIGDELFVSGFDWMAKEILNEYLAVKAIMGD